MSSSKDSYARCYAKNKHKYIAKQVERNKKKVEETRQFLWDYKLERGCKDCPESDPVVMEFDHLEDKTFTISGKAARYSRVRLVAELEKCDVVCANCHRRRTASRGGWHKNQLGG